MPGTRRGPLLLALALVLAAASVALLTWRIWREVAPARPVALMAPSALVGRPLPSLGAAVGWTGPGRPDSLAGRVVVVAFLSVNLPPSARAMATLEAWHEAYARYGLRVIGIQEPEFAFAAAPASLAAAAARFGLRFPLGLDPALELRRTFGGFDATPRFVLAAADGRVVMDRGGLGSLPEMEIRIRSLLRAARPEIQFPAAAPALGPPPGRAPHPPVHLGSSRVERGPLAGAEPGSAITFTAQLRYQVEGQPYTPYPVGRWTPGADGLTAARGGAQDFVALRYDAGALGAVLGPAESGPVRVWILEDEGWLAPGARGADVQVDGRGASYVLVTEARLYSLVRPGRGMRGVKLSPESPGVTIFAFTFEEF